MKKYLSILVLLVTGLNTSKFSNIKAQVPEYYYKIDNKLLETAQDFEFTRFACNIELIPIESNSKSIIGNVQKIRTNNNNFFIQTESAGENSESQLYMFNRDGKFVSKIGNRGKGPGEYNKLLDFSVINSSEDVAILDYNKLLIYSSNLKYKKSTSIQCIDRGMITKIEMLNNGNVIGGGLGDYKILLFDSLGHQISKFFKYENANLSVRTPLTNFSDNILINLFFNDTIFIYSNASIRPYIRLDFGNKQLTYKDFLNTNRNSKLPKLLPEDQAFINFALEVNNKILIIFMYDQNKYQLIINKNTKEYILYKFHKDDALINLFPMELSYTDTGKLLFWVDAIDIVDNISYFNDLNNIAQRKLLLKNINENSNPVIVLFNLSN